ncbi:4270_t:CDS:2, partial [Racocetra persica]
MEKDRIEIQIENDKGPPVIDKKDIKESALFTKSAAVSQDETFLVIFDSIDDYYENVIIRMYNVNIDEAGNKDLSETFEQLKLTLKFDGHEEQSWLMASSSFSSWSIAVSNEYRESFRLLALSCISDDFKAKECNSVEINDGGIIQFISGAGEFILILIKGNGIYKHRLRYSSDNMRFQHNVLALNYPERIINALKYNCSENFSRSMIVPPSDI